jgi:hypothetical protein
LHTRFRKSKRERNQFYYYGTSKAPASSHHYTRNNKNLLHYGTEVQQSARQNLVPVNDNITGRRWSRVQWRNEQHVMKTERRWWTIISLPFCKDHWLQSMSETCSSSCNLCSWGNTDLPRSKSLHVRRKVLILFLRCPNQSFQSVTFIYSTVKREQNQQDFFSKEEWARFDLPLKQETFFTITLAICFFWGRYDFSFAHDLLAVISTEQYKK